MSLIILYIFIKQYKFLNQKNYLMKKTISLLALFLLFSIEMQAQVTNVLNNFYTVWVKPAIPIIGGIVLVVGALMNMGKVLHSESRDIKGFISGIVLYVAVYFSVVGIVAYIIAG